MTPADFTARDWFFVICILAVMTGIAVQAIRRTPDEPKHRKPQDQ